jgi:RNA:NAD 2'-phosphotransferase (TPT1/KptA family)
MRRAGAAFFRAANGVWLVEAVGTEYLKVIEH